MSKAHSTKISSNCKGKGEKMRCVKSFSFFPLSPLNGAEEYFYCLLYLLKEDLCLFFLQFKIN